MSDTGRLRIGWDSDMIIPSEYTEIPKQKTAVTDWSAFNYEDAKARLDIGYYDVFGKKPSKILALISSLEVRLLYEDPELAAD